MTPHLCTRYDEKCVADSNVVASRLPWVPEVFLACGGNFRCWPKAEATSGEAFRAGHYKVQKPESALEKSLAPRVRQGIFKGKRPHFRLTSVGQKHLCLKGLFHDNAHV